MFSVYCRSNLPFLSHFRHPGSVHLSRLDHPWSTYALKQCLATVKQLVAVIGALCLPLLRLTVVAFATVLLNIFVTIRRCYVEILTVVFDYATRIKKDKEILFHTDLFHIESSSSSSFTEKTMDSSSISESSDYFTQLSSETSSTDQELPDDDPMLSTRRQSLRRSRSGLPVDIHFNLGRFESRL